MEDVDEALKRFHRLGGESLARKMIGAFVGNAEDRIGAARRALDAGDLKELERACHSLKSSAANFGAATLVDLAGDVEALAARPQADGDGDGELTALVARLPGAFAEVRAYLATTEPTDEDDRGR